MAPGVWQQGRSSWRGVHAGTCYAWPLPADATCATVARLLDDEWGIMTRAGLHCAPAAHRSLHTAPEGTLRLSWGVETTSAEIDTALEALRAIAVTGRSGALSGAQV